MTSPMNPAVLVPVSPRVGKDVGSAAVGIGTDIADATDPTALVAELAAEPRALVADPNPAVTEDSRPVGAGILGVVVGRMPNGSRGLVCRRSFAAVAPTGANRTMFSPTLDVFT